MKKIFVFALAAGLFAACSSSSKTTDSETDTMSTNEAPPVDSPVISTPMTPPDTAGVPLQQ